MVKFTDQIVTTINMVAALLMGTFLFYNIETENTTTIQHLEKEKKKFLICN